MAKIFNVNGACRPNRHYMVDLGSRLKAIRGMVDNGECFIINRARQYGKTTILRALSGYLDIRQILEKFIETFSEIYGDEDESFLENVGRKYFLLFLKPIINGIMLSGLFSHEKRVYVKL